jgi:selenocysteine lyase/cysteine desulfurase
MPKLDDWDAVRAQFRLSPRYRHFAGFFLASHPTPVRDAIESFRAALDDNPILTVERGMFESQIKNLLFEVRRDAANYLGGKPEEIALTPNTTTGLALVYLGLALKASDEILTTTHDHFVHHEAIRLATNISGASARKISLFDSSATATVGGIVERVRSAIRPATRVIGLTWVHSSSGIRLPVRDIALLISEFNRARSESDQLLLVIDGVHGLGVLDETVTTLGADFFCAGTHKWLFAPRGTGIVWASAENWARIRPVIPTFSTPEPYLAWVHNRVPRGPTIAEWVSPGGSLAYEHQWAMGAAFRMHMSIGRSRVATRILELNARLKQGLSEIRQVKLQTPRSIELSAGICCFDVAGMTAGAVTKKLLDHGIVASASPYAISYARLSAGLMNSITEVDEALLAMRRIVGG